MKNSKTKNLTINQKRRLMRDQFAEENLQISRTTVHKIQRNLLRYSYKRICQYVPKYLGNKKLKRIFFIMKFFDILANPNCKLFVLDEVGFGTRHLRHYAYSKIGEPALLETKKKLKYNLTCTACISEDKVELIKFFS